MKNSIHNSFETNKNTDVIITKELCKHCKSIRTPKNKSQINL